MVWSRSQMAAVSVVPVLFAAWMIMRVVPSEPRSEPGTRPPAAAAAAPPARREPPPLLTSLEVVTDGSGKFELRGLAAGRYRVTFGEPADRAFTTIDDVQVNDLYGVNLVNLSLHTAGDTAPLRPDEFQPNRLPRLIRGNVVDSGGAPLPGIRVRAQRR